MEASTLEKLAQEEKKREEVTLLSGEHEFKKTAQKKTKERVTFAKRN